MDNVRQAATATQNGPASAARIVRNIEQIEADSFIASGLLSERMMREAVQSIRMVATAPWQIIETGWAAQIGCPEWKMTKGVGTGDAWLELAEICADGEREFSWISAAIGAGPTRMGIELMFRRGLQDSAQAVIRDDKVLADLRKLGMVRDEAEPRLFFPIDIPSEALAQGFEANDLAKALAPVGKAMEKAIVAKAEVEKLIEAVRTMAKRK